MLYPKQNRVETNHVIKRSRCINKTWLTSDLGGKSVSSSVERYHAAHPFLIALDGVPIPLIQTYMHTSMVKM